MEITGLKVSLRKGEDVLVGIKMMKITAGCKRKHLTWRWGQTQEQEQAAQRCVCVGGMLLVKESP